MYRDSEFPKKAATLRLIADLGALAAVWPLLDSLLGQHAMKPRVPAGTSNLAELALELALVVAKALAEGVATPDQTPIAGLTALAAKGGSSQAVRTAKQALEFFKDLAAEKSSNAAPATAALLNDEEFAEAWPVNKDEAYNPRDGFTVSLEIVNGLSKENRLQVTLSKGKEIYLLEDGGSLRTLEYEGQTCGQDPDGRKVWLRWDETEGRLVAAAHQNWKTKDDTKVKMESRTMLTDSLIAVAFAHMQDRPRTLYPDNRVWVILLNRLASAAGVSAAMDKLLENSEFNPTRMFGFMEKNPRFLRFLWPVLTLCLAYATAQETPPRWTPRCLDAITAYAQVLATATTKGIIPAEAWEPLRELAGAKKKSAARTKAQELVGVLLVA